MIRSDKGDARLKACGVLNNLSVSAENGLLLTSSELGLLSTLVSILKSDQDVARASALNVLYNLSCSASNRQALMESGLVPVVSELMQSAGALDIRVKLTTVILHLSLNNELKTALVTESGSLLPALVLIIAADKGEARVKATAVVWSLTGCPPQHRNVLKETPLGLVESLLALLSDTDAAEARVNACGALNNLSIAFEE